MLMSEVADGVDIDGESAAEAALRQKLLLRRVAVEGTMDEGTAADAAPRFVIGRGALWLQPQRCRWSRHKVDAY
jgi:hypothetical protein